MSKVAELTGKKLLGSIELSLVFMLALYLLVSSADNLNANSLDPDQARQNVSSGCKLFGIGIPNFFPKKSPF